MDAFFKIVGMLTIGILSFLTIMYIIQNFKKFKLFFLIYKLFQRLIYHNYEVWFVSKRMTKKECEDFLNAYKQALESEIVSKSDNNLIRFERAVKNRLSELNIDEYVALINNKK